jgi:hypothetical protein
LFNIVALAFVEVELDLSQVVGHLDLPVPLLIQRHD